MPLGMKPVCSSCKISTSAMWRKGLNGDIQCNSCATKQSPNNGGKETGSNGTGSKTNGNGGNGGPILRKSSRNKPSKYRMSSTTKAVATKGKSRRILFKKSQPIKAPSSVATVVTGESIFHDGLYYQAGDIVSLVDHDGTVYYAQIRGFLQDQYYEKSAVITWLLPTQKTQGDMFDPHTYILGPEEDLPRKMEYMEFVCHAPSDYFKAKKAPYPTISSKPELCYIWSSIRPVVKVAPTMDEIFGLNEGHLQQKAQSVRIEKEKSKDREKKISQTGSQ
ncbi:hypothetical protein CHS0354_015051 [Potamilus streckersoni]|uniref:GATA zinc finger domain-containing protein 1 n=1 Tax=Potamilus streckersoni TaxID=2493646 RepID=A0AAE0TGA2_9BIVA|nr:hypothetical protein CHS0354_015051 [Potamilus streckersoni]